MAVYLAELNGGASDFLLRDGGNAMEADLDMGTHKIVNLATPVASTDLSTKLYADTNVAVTAAQVAAARGIVADIRIEFASNTLVGGRVLRFDAGTAMSVAATATPSATQIGTNSTSTGFMVIKDGSAGLLTDATSNLRTWEVQVVGGNVSVCQPFIQPTAADTITVHFNDTTGTGAYPGVWTLHMRKFSVPA